MELDSELTPPLRYGIVNPGLYRGSYPTLRNFRFLSRLQLKTMLCLSPESPSFDIESFCEMAGTRTIHIQINRTNALNESLQATLLNAINVSVSVFLLQLSSDVLLS